MVKLQNLIEKYNNGLFTKNELFANIYILIKNKNFNINDLEKNLKKLFLEFQEFLKCKKFVWSSGKTLKILNILESKDE